MLCSHLTELVFSSCKVYNSLSLERSLGFSCRQLFLVSLGEALFSGRKSKLCGQTPRNPDRGGHWKAFFFYSEIATKELWIEGWHEVTLLTIGKLWLLWRIQTRVQKRRGLVKRKEGFHRKSNCPQNIHVLISDTCQYITLLGKGDFADVIKDLEIQRLSQIMWVNWI